MRRGIRSKPFVPLVLFLCLTALLIGGTGSIAESAAAKNKPKTPKAVQKETEKKSDVKIIAYYFHGNFRCVSCKKIEAYSGEAIKKGFAKELKDGVLEWRVVNIEEKGNEHFIQDYKLYTKSLVLVEMKDGKQVKWKNLEKVWDYLNDQATFTKYVTDEVPLFLKDATKEDKKKAKT